MSTYVKFINLFPEIKGHIQEVRPLSLSTVHTQKLVVNTFLYSFKSHNTSFVQSLVSVLKLMGRFCYKDIRDGRNEFIHHLYAY